ncbi:hypothetical protein AgCh_014181 [Apium graveolens]
MHPWPTVNQAFMLLKQEEKQRQTHSSVIPPVTMMVNMSKHSPPGSYIPNRFSDRSHPVQEYSHCHFKGHTNEKCYKLHSYPLDHPNHPSNISKRKPSSRFTVNSKPSAAMQASTEHAKFPTDAHLTSKMDALQTQLNTLMKFLNTQGTGSTISMPTTGQYSLATHIAGTSFSLLSAIQIPDNVWDQYQKTGLVLGSLVDGLYQLHNVPTTSSAMAISHTSASSDWHKRLGHIPSLILSKIHTLGNLDISMKSLDDISASTPFNYEPVLTDTTSSPNSHDPVIHNDPALDSEGFPLSVVVFRKIFQCYNSSSSICGWVYIKQRPKCKHIFNNASIPDNNQNWRNSFVGLRWENGDWGTLFRSSFRKVSDGSLKSIHLTLEETIIYDELTRDDGATISWNLLEEFSLIHVGLSSVSQQGDCEDEKARLAGLDTQGKDTEPSFLRKHMEPMVEVPAEGAEAHNAPITIAAHVSVATGAFQPLWGFRRGDTMVGSIKYAWDWSYHSVTPKEFTDMVATPDLERIKLMGAQSLASRASDKADNALRKQQKKYAALERKLKRKEEKLGESNVELVVLRAERYKAIDNYLDSKEFTQSMRVRDDSVFPRFFRTGWDTALGTVNEACPDINPPDYVCPDDEALLQRFRTRVVISDRIPQDPLLLPPESSSRPAADDSSSSSGMTETFSESRGDDDMDAEGTSAP